MCVKAFVSDCKILIHLIYSYYPLFLEQSCTDIDCQNGATCNMKDIAQCECRLGFHGDYCEKSKCIHTSENCSIWCFSFWQNILQLVDLFFLDTCCLELKPPMKTQFHFLYYYQDVINQPLLPQPIIGQYASA